MRLAAICLYVFNLVDKMQIATCSYYHLVCWDFESIRPNEIDEVIPAEIPDNEEVLMLTVVTKNMIRKHVKFAVIDSNVGCTNTN